VGVTNAGNTITNDSGDAGSFDLNPSHFDAVVVARKYSGPTTIPTAQLIAYVQGGGNVLVSLGSALNNDTGWLQLHAPSARLTATICPR